VYRTKEWEMNLVSKTRMLTLVQELKWKDVKAAIRGNPGLLGFRDKKGRNWLHVCCSVNITKRRRTAADSIRTAEVLLDAGVGINEPATTEGTWEATALWYSIAFGENLALAEYLLKRGADPNHCLWAAVNRDNAAAIRLLIQNGAADPTTEEASPLLAAIHWNKFAAAEELLKLGADANFQDSRKMTALHYLLKNGGEIKYVRMLINYGARWDLKNESGVTAAEVMMRKRDPDFRRMAKHLLARS
jgi:uncharacterized protein